MEHDPEISKPTLRARLGSLARNIPFPVGLAVVAFGVGMIALPAGIIAAGVFTALIGWAVE